MNEGLKDKKNCVMQTPALSFVVYVNQEYFYVGFVLNGTHIFYWCWNLVLIKQTLLPKLLLV